LETFISITKWNITPLIYTTITPIKNIKIIYSSFDINIIFIIIIFMRQVFPIFLILPTYILTYFSFFVIYLFRLYYRIPIKINRKTNSYFGTKLYLFLIITIKVFNIDVRFNTTCISVIIILSFPIPNIYNCNNLLFTFSKILAFV
jgi:hypothetical protein